MSHPLRTRYKSLMPLSGYAYAILLLGTYALIILTSTRAPRLQDYPSWVYEGVAVSHLLAGHPDTAFLWKPFPVPNMVSDIGLGILCSFLSWIWAAKVWLCLYLAAAAIASLHFARSMESPRAPYCLWIAPTVLVVNLCFWWGFVNFQISLLLVLLFCSMLLRGDADPVFLGAVLVAAFLAHAVGFAVCVVCLSSYVLIKRAWRLVPALIPVSLLVVWYVYGRFFTTGNPEQTVLTDTPLPFLSRAFAFYKVNSLMKSLGYVNPKVAGVPLAAELFGPWMMALMMMVAAALAVTLAFAVFLSARRSYHDKGRDQFLWVAIAIIFVAGIFSPSRALGISDPGARLITSSLALAVLLLQPGGYMFRVSCALSGGLGVFGLLLFASLQFGRRSEQPQVQIPSVVRDFAHVDPDGRSYYYDSLRKGEMIKPVFGTSLLYNRRNSLGVMQEAASTSSHGSLAAGPPTSPRTPALSGCGRPSPQ